MSVHILYSGQPPADFPVELFAGRRAADGGVYEFEERLGVASVGLLDQAADEFLAAGLAFDEELLPGLEGE